MSEPTRLGASPQPVDVTLPLAQVVKLAQECGHTGRYEDAEILLQAALRAAPHDADVLHLTGIVAYQQGKLAQASQYMERAVAERPDVSLYLRNVCSVYERLGRYDEFDRRRPACRPARSVRCGRAA